MIYVDDKQIPYGRMKMCHCLADTTEELRALARKIGIDPKHIERPGEPNEHLNLSQAYRTKAIKEGALEITSRAMVQLIRHKRGLSAEERAGTPDTGKKKGGVTVTYQDPPSHNHEFDTPPGASYGEASSDHDE